MFKKLRTLRAIEVVLLLSRQYGINNIFLSSRKRWIYSTYTKMWLYSTCIQVHLCLLQRSPWEHTLKQTDSPGGFYTVRGLWYGHPSTKQAWTAYSTQLYQSKCEEMGWSSAGIWSNPKFNRKCSGPSGPGPNTKPVSYH